MSTSLPFFLLLLLFSLIDFSSFASAGHGVQLLIVNNCNNTVWPGILGTAGYPTPLDGGFQLHNDEQLLFNVPQNWSGRIWGRQGCFFNPTTGKGLCQTGDCAGQLKCLGIGGAPPTTVVEMTFGTPNSPLHYYDVSLIDGFNLPVSMVPLGGGGSCGVAACEVDLNGWCPRSLEVKRGGDRVAGCKSACLATGLERYCCTGVFGSRDKCPPTVFGRVFKAVCPRAYSYAFDEVSGLKTCTAPRYVITFCPPN